LNTHLKFVIKSLLYIAIGLLLNITSISAQENKTDSKPGLKAMMRDTLDGQLDFSSFLIDAHGFIPIPFIITEPALGGFGFALIPVFITPPKSKFATKRTPPDITGAIGLYTVNNSWMVGGFRLASIPKWSMKYRVALAYADMNLSFYRDVQTEQQREFEFNFLSKPVLLSLSKKITKQEVYFGLQYLYLKSTIKPLFSEELPDPIEEKELNSATATFSPFLDWDRRDNTFTPDHGAIIRLQYDINDEWTGSDYSFERINGNLNWFLPIQERWISGLRVEVQHAFNEPPFYMLPFINLRGLPIFRYQGQTTALMETEQRFDLNRRWSLVGFAGVGKAIQENESFSDGTTVYNIGGGFRYLLARVFKVRAWY
jgi:hypothetical protein